MTIELNGLHAVVTGGSGGIGRAVAKTLLDAGLLVTIMGRHEERLGAAARGLGARVTPQVCDVTDEAAVERAFAEAARRGPVLVLVNNAGSVESAPLARTSPAMWRAMFDANATSAFLCQRQVLPAMQGAAFGRIVNIASTAALKGYAYVAAYTAAKHALLGLTRASAIELAARGITVNAVCPGYVDTPMTARAIEAITTATGRSADEARAALVATNPQGRLVDPAEVASAVRWLVSLEAGSVTGQAIVVAGGEVM